MPRYTKRYAAPIETDRGWYEDAKALLRSGEFDNACVLIAENSLEVAELGVGEHEVNLLGVDGPERDVCVRRALGLTKPGGYIYLDNSDIQSPERRAATAQLIAGVKEAGGNISVFVDFPPGMFQVAEGMLANLPSPGQSAGQAV